MLGWPGRRSRDRGSGCSITRADETCEGGDVEPGDEVPAHQPADQPGEHLRDEHVQPGALHGRHHHERIENTPIRASPANPPR